MPFVLDASVTLSWAFADEQSDYGEAVLKSVSWEPAFVPDIWPVEMANVLLVGVRKSRLTEAERDAVVARLLALPITIHASEPQPVLTRVAELAASAGLTVYDALYLDLAAQSGLPLATLDRQLRLAAEKQGIPLYQP